MTTINQTIPQTKAQWIGFLVWAAVIYTLEYQLGKKKPLGASSQFELIWVLLALSITYFLRRKDGK